MHMKDRTIYLAYFALSLLQVVSQSSNVTSCTPLYQWSLNSKSQTPCLVAAFLESACEGPVTINALPFGNHYTGPDTLAEATRCRCSTVTYSLISACAGCQDRRFQNWTDWSAQCPEVEVGQFLQTVPPQVVVPAWAYLNVTKSNNTFNPILAQNNQSSEALSESAASSSSTSSGVISRNTDVITPPPPPAPSHKSNAGAIAGGVVAGLAVLVASGLAVFIWRRRQGFSSRSQEMSSSRLSPSPRPMTEHIRDHSVTSPMSISPFPYDSSDTTTYPGSPVISAVHTTFDAPLTTPAVRVIQRYAAGSAEL